MIIVILIFLSYNVNLYSKVIILPADSLKFETTDLDSIFIFTDNLAVTASGKNIEKLNLINNVVSGPDIPSTLKLRNPMGAILYKQTESSNKIPVIIGRQNTELVFDILVRDYFVNMSQFKGHSQKGGVEINVWQKGTEKHPFLIFLKNGKVLGNSNSHQDNNKNFEQFNINTINKIQNEIAGVWLYPPEMGNNLVTKKIIELMTSGPVLVEFWDGLSWQMFEEGYLSNVVKGAKVIIGQARMGYALFPPETKSNYSALIGSGLTNIAKYKNLFHALSESKIPFQVLEGEKLIFPIPGQVELHTGATIESKDENIFNSACASIRELNLGLLFVHYHGLDDLNHSCGPYDERTIAHFTNLWEWHKQIRKEWNGNILIISDHGAHSITNKAELNEKFIKKGTKGSHGDFIFADMAVPFIEQESKGKKVNNFKLTQEQSKKIWETIGTPLDEDEVPLEHIQKSMKLTYMNQTTVYLAVKDNVLFNNDFSYSYLKKGQVIKGNFKGVSLINLIKNSDISKISKIIISSFDNHKLVFSDNDLKNCQLVIGINYNEINIEGSFTLYPLKDKFPNRVIKFVKEIRVF